MVSFNNNLEISIAVSDDSPASPDAESNELEEDIMTNINVDGEVIFIEFLLWDLNVHFNVLKISFCHDSYRPLFHGVSKGEFMMVLS